jgi:hypothetical protein
VLNSSRPYGFRYANRTIRTVADTIASLALPQTQIVVADLLPS